MLQNLFYILKASLSLNYCAKFSKNSLLNLTDTGIFVLSKQYSRPPMAIVFNQGKLICEGGRNILFEGFKVMLIMLFNSGSKNYLCCLTFPCNVVRLAEQGVQLSCCHCTLFPSLSAVVYYYHDHVLPYIHWCACFLFKPLLFASTDHSPWKSPFNSSTDHIKEFNVSYFVLVFFQFLKY